MAEGHIEVRARDQLLLDGLFAEADVLLKVFLELDVTETGVQLV